MRNKGLVEQMSRGLYRLAEQPALDEPDLVTVTKRVPHGVISLLSALSLHGLTSEIPHQIFVALPRGFRPPRIEYPPIQVCWFSGASFSEGIESRNVDGMRVRVYGPAKSVADCFKFRGTIGQEAAIEALKRYLRTKHRDVDELLRFARICRVEKIVRRYLEALL